MFPLLSVHIHSTCSIRHEFPWNRRRFQGNLCLILQVEWSTPACGGFDVSIKSNFLAERYLYSTYRTKYVLHIMYEHSCSCAEEPQARSACCSRKLSDIFFYRMDIPHSTHTNTRFAWAGGTFFLVVLYVVSVFGSGRKKVLVQF